MKNQQALLSAYRLSLLQISFVVFIAVALALFFGRLTGLSFFYGGLVNLLPSLYFAKKMFQYRGARNAQKIVKGFYRGEAVKIIVTIALFAVIFKFMSIEPVVFFSGFIVAQLSFWVAPFFFKNKQK